MKGKRHSEEQMIAILKLSEAGLKTTEVCRQNGISEQTFYRWKAKYGDLEASDAKKLRHLEDENRQLKQVVAELTLDNRILQRSAASYAMKHYSISERLACRLIQVARSTKRYVPRSRADNHIPGVFLVCW